MQRTDFDVRIERTYDAAVGRVELVPQEIGRVFLNLLNNAIHAVGEQTGSLALPSATDAEPARRQP